MSKEGYLVLAISILVVLLIVFIVSFVIYQRMPAPKGCEDIKINDENCSSCHHKECSFYKGHEEE